MRIQLFILSFSPIPSFTVVIVSWLCKKYVILFQLGPVYKKYSWRFDSIRTMSKIVRVRVFFYFISNRNSLRRAAYKLPVGLNKLRMHWYAHDFTHCRFGLNCIQPNSLEYFLNVIFYSKTIRLFTSSIIINFIQIKFCISILIKLIMDAISNRNVFLFFGTKICSKLSLVFFS